MHQLKNDLLSIKVKSIGAELSQLSSSKNNTDYLWDANPNVWANHAPNLFPIIGALKNNIYNFNSEEFQLPKHGFIRYNEDIVLENKTTNSLTFLLKENTKTLKQFPFKFEYRVIYTLIENKLTVTYQVNNKDDKTMYFSVGGHPAFKCPIFKNESYNDYFLEFENNETSKTYLLDDATGLISDHQKPIFTTENTIVLSDTLFESDALIFKDLTSRKVHLKSTKNGSILTLNYTDYNYLGIWAKPKASFVCIEPWLGIADHVNTNQNLKTKEGIITLEPNKTFLASYTIEIHLPHLV